MSTETHIALSIVTFFVLLGIILPITQKGIGESASSYDAESLVSDINEGQATTTSAWQIIKSVFSMFFWTFGALPTLIDAIFLILRIYLGISLAKMLRG